MQVVGFLILMLLVASPDGRIMLGCVFGLAFAVLTCVFLRDTWQRHLRPMPSTAQGPVIMKCGASCFRERTYFEGRVDRACPNCHSLEWRPVDIKRD